MAYIVMASASHVVRHVHSCIGICIDVHIDVHVGASSPEIVRPSVRALCVHTRRNLDGGGDETTHASHAPHTCTHRILVTP